MSQIISNDFLYKKIRVQGGAYGGFTFYAYQSGLLPLLSYRDPHLEETFEVFSQLADWLANNLDDDTVEGSRIGTIGAFDRIRSPSQILEEARRHQLYGISDEHRKAFRDGLFSVTADQIRKTALPQIEKALANAPRAALGSKVKLNEASAKLNRKLEIVSLD